MPPSCLQILHFKAQNQSNLYLTKKYKYHLKLPYLMMQYKNLLSIYKVLFEYNDLTNLAILVA